LRICVVSEALRRPFDEGVKIFAYNLVKELSQVHMVLGLSRTNEFVEDIEEVCLKALPKNKFFVSTSLKAIIRTFKPDLICYLPTAHATLFSFIRAQVLKYYGKNVKTILITLQPRDYSFAARNMISFLVPDLVLAQSDKTYEVLKGLGCKTEKITCGVDLEKFIPRNNEVKERLKKKYGLPENKYIVLHVGHINKNRNAQYMESVQSMEGVQAVVVGSTSYPEDKTLVGELRQKGVIIFTDFLEHIEEIYLCADCYVFPVLCEGACIEIPLSILEALASDLPVITTKFGGLPNFIPEQPGFAYVDDVAEIAPKIDMMRSIPAPETRRIVERYSWKNIATQVVMATKAI
jgi:glycosyltransferase involved in cell wall biosynthesis